MKFYMNGVKSFLPTCVPSSGPPIILKPKPVSALSRVMFRLLHSSFQPGGGGWFGCRWAGCMGWLGAGAEFSNDVAPVCCRGGWFRLFCCSACARARWSVGFGVLDRNLVHKHNTIINHSASYSKEDWSSWSMVHYPMLCTHIPWWVTSYNGYI